MNLIHLRQHIFYVIGLGLQVALGLPAYCMERDGNHLVGKSMGQYCSTVPYLGTLWWYSEPHWYIVQLLHSLKVGYINIIRNVSFKYIHLSLQITKHTRSEDSSAYDELRGHYSTRSIDLVSIEYFCRKK